MKLSEFDYELPKEAIADYPNKKRSGCKLLHVNPANNQLESLDFNRIIDLLNPGDLLVFNDSKVVKARVFASKESGKSIELLVERVINKFKALVHLGLKKNRLKCGDILFLDDDKKFSIKVVDLDDDGLVEIESNLEIKEIMKRFGEVPIPPYMGRRAEEIDDVYYQTVYAKKAGSVAAPTAGLHFDKELLKKLETYGINFGYLTLHVGAGTFKSVQTDNIEDHKMHKELIELDGTLVDKINETKKRGNRVVAVGTTSMRALETAYSNGHITEFFGETGIFIYPGVEIKIVDALLTNFHVPKSSLIMLVSAFAGIDLIRDAYKYALSLGYKFLSYGDAMFISNKVRVKH